jgi:hypothetical protein
MLAAILSATVLNLKLAARFLQTATWKIQLVEEPTVPPDGVRHLLDKLPCKSHFGDSWQIGVKFAAQAPAGHTRAARG